MIAPLVSRRGSVFEIVAIAPDAGLASSSAGATSRSIAIASLGWAGCKVKLLCALLNQF